MACLGPGRGQQRHSLAANKGQTSERAGRNRSPLSKLRNVGWPHANKQTDEWTNREADRQTDGWTLSERDERPNGIAQDLPISVSYFVCRHKQMRHRKLQPNTGRVSGRPGGGGATFAKKLRASLLLLLLLLLLMLLLLLASRL